MASSFLRFIDHTQRRTTVGRTPLDKWSARRRDLYLTTHNTHNRQTSMPPVGFEPTISTGERPQTYSLDRAATGIGIYIYIYIYIYKSKYYFCFRSLLNTLTELWSLKQRKKIAEFCLIAGSTVLGQRACRREICWRDAPTKNTFWYFDRLQVDGSVGPEQ